MTTEAIVGAAEKMLAELSHELFGLRAGECLLCYVNRMITTHDCVGLRFAKHYRDVRAPRATALEGRLGQMGGFCDCEIFLNAYQLHPALFVRDQPTEDDQCPEVRWPDPLPTCLGARRGSTQPCRLWCRQIRGGRWC